MNNIVIIGNSSTARTVFNFIQKYKLFHVIGFAIHDRYKNSDSFCELPLYSIEQLDRIINKNTDFLFIAVQWNKLNRVRRDLYEELKSKSFRFANLVSPSAVINGSICGDNCWIADKAVVDFGAKIGNNVFIKVLSMIGPSTIVCDHCFIGAKSTIGGSAVIGMQSFVGLNATVLDEVHIGEKSIIGAASVIKRSVDNYTLIKTKTSDINVIKVYEEIEIESKLIAAKNVR